MISELPDHYPGKEKTQAVDFILYAVEERLNPKALNRKENELSYLERAWKRCCAPKLANLELLRNSKMKELYQGIKAAPLCEQNAFVKFCIVAQPELGALILEKAQIQKPTHLYEVQRYVLKMKPKLTSPDRLPSPHYTIIENLDNIYKGRPDIAYTLLYVEVICMRIRPSELRRMRKTLAKAKGVEPPLLTLILEYVKLHYTVLEECRMGYNLASNLAEIYDACRNNMCLWVHCSALEDLELERVENCTCEPEGDFMDYDRKTDSRRDYLEKILIKEYNSIHHAQRPFFTF